MGAWIEICYGCTEFVRHNVAPLVGAWIEILYGFGFFAVINVAPLVGAWIEIVDTLSALNTVVSLPLWERGLKLDL